LAKFDENIVMLEKIDEAELLRVEISHGPAAFLEQLVQSRLGVWVGCKFGQLFDDAWLQFTMKVNEPSQEIPD
jgi:hypothetical protein